MKRKKKVKWYFVTFWTTNPGKAISVNSDVLIDDIAIFNKNPYIPLIFNSTDETKETKEFTEFK